MPSRRCIYGVSGFTGEIGNFPTVATPVFQSVAALPGQRNRGFVTKGLKLSSDGLIVKSAGVYDVSMSVVIGKFVQDNPGSSLFNIFLVVDGIFIPTSANLIGSTASLEVGQVVTFTGSNLLKLKKGSSLSFIINNGGDGAQTVTVFAWGMTANRMCKKIC